MNKKNLYTLALLLVAGIIFTGCRNNETPEAIVVANPESLEQTVSADARTGTSTVKFTTQASWISSIAEESTGASVMWASISPWRGNAGDHNITINLQPNTTGADRTAIITITSGDEDIQIRITQRYVRADGTIPVAGVTLSESALELTVGETKKLTATVTPDNAANQNVTWSSSRPAVASVTDGVVTALTAGTTTITVTTDDGGKRGTAQITVTPIGIGTPTETTDPGVLIGAINGNPIRWATRNVDVPGTFAPYSHSSGRLFQWGTLDGVTHHFDSTTDGAIDGWHDFTTAADRVAWTADNDPCPQGWRVPTQQQLQSLINAGSAWITYNGVRGRLYGTAPNVIFLPAVGWRSDSDGTLFVVDTGGYYWSNTQSGSPFAINLWLSSGNSGMLDNWRALGFSVRCVAE